MLGESNSSSDASKCKREMTPETTDISGHHGHSTVTGTPATVGVLIAEGTPPTPDMTETLRICNRSRLALLVTEGTPATAAGTLVTAGVLAKEWTPAIAMLGISRSSNSSRDSSKRRMLLTEGTPAKVLYH